MRHGRLDSQWEQASHVAAHVCTAILASQGGTGRIDPDTINAYRRSRPDWSRESVGRRRLTFEELFRELGVE